MSARRPHSSYPYAHRNRRLISLEPLENRSLLTAFVPGNIAVYRVGDGTQTLASTGNAVFIDEYTPSGGLVQSIPLAADTVNAGNANTLIADGTQIAEGMLTLSADGRSLAVPGYNPTGTFNRNLPERVVGLVDIGGGVDLSTTGNFNKDNSFRGAFRNGNQIYTVGGGSTNGGVAVANVGTSSGHTLVCAGSLMRTVNVFNGQLYISTVSGTTRVATVGTGTPTTSGQTATNLPGFPTTGSPYQFFFADLSASVAGVDTLYVADDTTNGGEIQKYSLSGGNWTALGAIPAPTVRGLTGFVSGSTVTLYGATGGSASGGGSLYAFTDSTGYNASVSGTATTIASAGTKTAFRGVARVPDDGIGAISNIAEDAAYLAGTSPISIGDSATFSDQSNFKGGSLTVRFISGGTDDDTLSIADGNGIVADSGDVLFNGTQIGTYPLSGVGSGLSGSQLTISFNAVLSSDPVGSAAVQALLRQISFSTTSAAGGGDRHLELAIQQNDGQTATAETTVSVTPANREPTANDADAVTDEDVATDITLTGSDPDGDSLTFTVTSGPTYGMLSGTAPNLTYTPDGNYHGADSFTFKVHDGEADSSEATISITVDPVNDAPAAEGDALTTDEDLQIEVTLVGSDIDGDSLTYVIVDPPAHGQISGTVPNLTYTPDANYHGEDSFSFKANDGFEESNTATVSLTISAVNDAPTAVSDSVVTDEDASKSITLVGDDVDGDGLTYIIVDSPAHGQLSGTAPNLTYTPDANYHGNDRFTFKVNDGAEDSGEATIEITINSVNDAPTAQADSAATDEDTPVGLDLTGTDLDGDSLTYVVTGDPAHGTLSGTAPNLVYTPNPNYFGDDSFTFKVNDGATDSSEVTISLNVAPVNDAPTAEGDSVSTDEDESLPIALQAEEVDGDVLTYVIVTAPARGTLTGTAPNLIYTPEANYHGSDSFVYKVNDGTADSGEATISISIASVNDAPTADEASLITGEDTALAVALSGDDVDGDSLTFIVVTPPQHGMLTGTAPDLVYIPDANYFGSDSFTYKSHDGVADSDAATISITVGAVNDAPVLVVSHPTLPAINEDATNPAWVRVSNLLADKSSDADPGDSLGIAITGISAQITVQYSLDEGANWVPMPADASDSKAVLLSASALLRVIPAPNYNGSARLYFRVWDGSNGLASASIVNLKGKLGGAWPYSLNYDDGTVIIAPVNDAPVLSPAAPTLNPISQGTISPFVTEIHQLLQGNVTDIDGAGKGIAVTWTGGMDFGRWQYNLGNGDWVDIGPTSSTAARLIPATAALRFLPFPSFHGDVKLFYRAWDRTQGTVGGVLDLTKNTGGTSSISRGYDNATQPVNMSPILEQSDTAPHDYTLNGPGVHFMWGVNSGQPTSLTDDDSLNFDKGVLRVHTVAGRRTGDRIEASWSFSIAGTSVYYKTTKIGTTTSNGKDGNDLRILFNANASRDLVRRLMNSLIFRTENGVATTRKLEVRVWDGDGAASNTLLRTINAD